MPAALAEPVIRVLTGDDDLVRLTQLLHRAYATLGAMGLNYTAVDQTVATTAQRVAGGRCLLAHVGERLVGTLLVQPTYADSACTYFMRQGVAAVHQFAVDPAVQGQGIGRRLLHAAETWAADAGYRELAMDTAEPATHLITVYQRWGYRPVDSVQWPGKVYRSVVLAKRLTDGRLDG